MTDQKMSSPNRNNVWIFYALTFIITWAFWIPMALSGKNVMEGPLMLLLLIGSFGPSIAGIIMTYRTQDREGRRDFWRRSFSFKLIQGKWYAVILLIFPAIYTLGILLDMLLGGNPPGAEAIDQISAQPASLIVMLLMTLLMGPVAEEFGWRGYAQDQSQSKWSALISSLILGIFWWIWHFPLFFMEGMLQKELGFGSVAFWGYGAFVFALSIIFTWVYNNNSRSILAAIMLHFMANATTNIPAPISDRASLLSIGLLVVVAIVIVMMWGPKTFTRNTT